jgi:hypothetical protein|tara:strand:- start:471 stop:1130 length:660 start_codon:yes stop_codon:yes gene_type:complete
MSQLVVALLGTTATIYLLVTRRLRTQEVQKKQHKSLSKFGALIRGRKTKKETDKLKAKDRKNRDPNYMAPFNPSADDVVNAALEMLQLNSSHKLWDLGCGDGRIVVEACVRHGCTGCGVEYDEKLCNASKQRAIENNVDSSIVILHDNIMNVDFSLATRMYLFLLPDGLKTLTPRVKQVLLNIDARVVTYAFAVIGLKPIEIKEHLGTKLYLYTAESIQ